jgi:hypothetical protein
VLRPILTVSSILLTLYFVFGDSGASRPARWGLGTALVGSFLLPPAWAVASILIQLGVSLYVLLRLQSARW